MLFVKSRLGGANGAAGYEALVRHTPGVCGGEAGGGDGHLAGFDAESEVVNDQSFGKNDSWDFKKDWSFVANEESEVADDQSFGKNDSSDVANDWSVRASAGAEIADDWSFSSTRVKSFCERAKAFSKPPDAEDQKAWNGG